MNNIGDKHLSYERLLDRLTIVLIISIFFKILNLNFLAIGFMLSLSALFIISYFGECQ